MSAPNTFHTVPEQTYFEFYKTLKNNSPRIRVEEASKTHFRDGGSSAYVVMNEYESGYQLVLQDFRIKSKTRGEWFGRKAEPNHKDWHPISFTDIDFV
jgi:hypothetical protein